MGNETIDMMIWERRNGDLVKDMEDFLKLCVKRGCKKCDKTNGYMHYPETGKVCDHMLERRYNRFKSRIDAELELLSIITHSV